jgi:cellulose synthase (UDP-forming)
MENATNEAKSNVAERRGNGPVIIGLAVVTVVLLCVYATFRGASLFNPGYRPVDHVFAFLLLSAEAFTLLQGVGYLLTVLRSTRKYRETRTRIFSASVAPSVAVVVASYNEDPAVLEDTIVSLTNLDYANKRVYLLDDSTNEDFQRKAEAMAYKYESSYVHRADRRGYKAGAINDLLGTLKEKYIAVFDADQKPSYNFLKEIVPLLEEDENLAFVQTPQYYANTQHSPVARAASYQQAVFYEYICEGKSTSNAMFCCGTNVILRVEALRSIGGFDETSVTEDFATSLLLHTEGWKSLYYNKVMVSGVGPETLAGYFTQQMRWAMGNLGIFKKLISTFFRQPGALRLAQWSEYFFSSSYYLIGWAYLIFAISPVAYILFNIQPLIADPLLYFAAFVPYFMVSLYAFYFTMGTRGYRPLDLFQGQSIGFISFWILINASVVAILGKKRAFGVTPKGVTGRLAIRYLTPQLVLLALSLTAVTVGIYRVIASADLTMLVTVFWAAYHCILLLPVFYFNRAFRGYPDTRIFENWGRP